MSRMHNPAHPGEVEMNARTAHKRNAPLVAALPARGALMESGYTGGTQEPEWDKGSQIETCEPLSLLVAGAGFEPATFGL